MMTHAPDYIVGRASRPACSPGSIGGSRLLLTEMNSKAANEPISCFLRRYPASADTVHLRTNVLASQISVYGGDRAPPVPRIADYTLMRVPRAAFHRRNR